MTLGPIAVAWWWFAKGFFTRAGESLGDEVGEDLKSAYRRFKDAVRTTIEERRQPIDQKPITLMTLNLDRPGGGMVLVEGSTRESDQTLDQFFDAGRDLAIVARAYLALSPDAHRLTRMHFSFGPRGWQFVYALDDEAERRMITILSDEEYDALLLKAKRAGPESG